MSNDNDNIKQTFSFDSEEFPPPHVLAAMLKDISVSHPPREQMRLAEVSISANLYLELVRSYIEVYYNPSVSVIFQKSREH